MTRARVRAAALALAAFELASAAAAPPAAADVPGTGIVRNIIGDTVGWAWDKVAAGIASWVLGGVAYFVDGVVNFLKTSASPDVGAAWFAGPTSPFATVRAIAVVLLVGFLFLGLLHGLVHGDPAGMVRRMAADLPVAVLGMVAVVEVTGRLLALTDALSTAVLTNSDGQAMHFLSGFGAAATAGTNGFAAVLLGLVAVVAALVLWVELLVRAALVYLLVAISPIGFAAMVWPTARGLLRRLAELLVAVVVSKFVICVALAVGVAALAGAGQAAPAGTGTGTAAAAGLGGLLVGGSVLALAAFSPFVVLKVMPIAEAALVAHGVSHAPLRTAQTGMSTYYSAGSLSRLAGRSNGALGAAPTTPPSAVGTDAAGAGAGASAGAGGVAVAAAAGRGAADAARRPGHAAADATSGAEPASGRAPTPSAPPSGSAPAATQAPPRPDPPRRPGAEH